MGTPHPAERVKLFVAILHAPDFNPVMLMDRLKARFGEVEASYGPVSFSWSDYYTPEMGSRLQKFYAIFSRTIDREELPGIKLWSNDIEAATPMTESDG